MISFLASPKPFTGYSYEQQYRAIRNWLTAADSAEVILYGNSPGIDDAARDLGVRAVRDVAAAPSGVPFFGAIAEHAAANARYDLQVYLNCDILLAGIAPALMSLVLPKFLLIGQRIDLGEGVLVDVAQQGWKNQLRRLAGEGKAKLHLPTGIDYFGFRRGMWHNLPPVAIGRAGYDSALLAFCMTNQIPLIDATYSVAALHQFHDYSHVQGGLQTIWHGPDAERNREYAGGSHSQAMVSDAQYLLVQGRLREQPCRGDRLREVELAWRFRRNWRRASLVVRILWRALASVGLRGIQQPKLTEVIDGLDG